MWSLMHIGQTEYVIVYVAMREITAIIPPVKWRQLTIVDFDKLSRVLLLHRVIALFLLLIWWTIACPMLVGIVSKVCAWQVIEIRGQLTELIDVL